MTFDGAFVGLQCSGAAIVAGTPRPATFGGQLGVTVAPGESVWSDAVGLPFVPDPASDADAVALAGRRAEGEAVFPSSTASWHVLDAMDRPAPADTRVVVAFGDAITDGTASTMNGDDRWSDVLSLPGVSTVIRLEGINDFSRHGGAIFEAVRDGMAEGVARLRAGLPGVRVVGAALTSALGSSSAARGHAEQDERRKALDAFIRTSGLFDGVADFDGATLDPATGGPGGRLHLNRAGCLAMGSAIDLGVLFDRPWRPRENRRPGGEWPLGRATAPIDDP